jgi:hypothetical protein
VSAKGKKRKAGESQDSAQFLEKTVKRVATPPVVKSQPQEPSVIDRYYEKHQLLLNTVKQLQDPSNAENMALLRNANDCIKVMVQTTQRIRSASNLGQNFHQQSG